MDTEFESQLLLGPVVAENKQAFLFARMLVKQAVENNKFLGISVGGNGNHEIKLRFGRTINFNFLFFKFFNGNNLFSQKRFFSFFFIYFAYNNCRLPANELSSVLLKNTGKNNCVYLSSFI